MKALLVAMLLVGCGSRTSLAGDDGDFAAVASPPQCTALGDACAVDADCCEGFACESSACARLPSACADDTGPVFLGDHFRGPLAVDARSVVGSEQGRIKRVPKVGGAGSIVVDDSVRLDAFVRSGDTLFFTRPGALEAVPTAGGSISTLAAVQGSLSFVVVLDEIVIADWRGMSVAVVDRASGDARPVGALSGETTYRVASTGETLYALGAAGETNLRLRRVALAGGAATEIPTDLRALYDLVAHGDDIYVANYLPPQVWRLRGGADTLELVADLTALGGPIDQLASDDAALYLALSLGNVQSRVVRVSMETGVSERLFETQGNQVGALVADADCIYYVDNSAKLGGLYRAPKVPR